MTPLNSAVSATPPAEVDVLVLYNSNAGLARHVARQLETHCMVKTKLDVVDIPRASAGMVRRLNQGGLLCPFHCYGIQH